MSGRPAIIRQRDVTRIVKGYAAAGIAVRLDLIDGKPVFRPIMGDVPAVIPSDKDRVDEDKDWHL